MSDSIEDKLNEMTAHIKAIYEQSKKEINEKINELSWQMMMAEAKLEHEKNLALADGDTVKANDIDAKLKSKQAVNELIIGKYEALIDEITYKLANVNQIALDYVNNQMSSIYAFSYNDAGADVETHIKGYSFDMVDEETVRYLATNDEDLLPNKNVNVPKDEQWNKKLIKSQLLQGILQGESNQEIAKRLKNIVGMNTESAIRNARTMTTSCENRGRLESYKFAQDKGVKMKKVWMCAGNDGRTRLTHLMLDGQEKDIEEPFEIEGYELMYPADPTGAPEMVYNCRCTMKIKYLGYEPVASAEPEPEPVVPTYTPNNKWADKTLSGASKEMKDSGSGLGNKFYNLINKQAKDNGLKATEQWANYKDGKVTDEEAEKIQKVFDKFDEFIAQQEAEALAEQKKIDDAIQKIEALKNSLGDFDSTLEYENIWKNPVTLKDYDSKKASIQAKKDYFMNQIQMLENMPETADTIAKIEKFKQLLADLDEFEVDGAEFSRLMAELKNAEKELKALTNPTAPNDAFSQERKDNALWARNPQEADRVIRQKTGEVWRNATKAERDSAYEYTESYHKYNEPLRGIEYGTSIYKGVGNTDLNASYARNGDRLNALTSIIDKCTYDEDIWMQRGIGFGGADKFLQVDPSLLHYGSQSELEQALLGKTVTEYGFMSCGDCKGKGFSHQPIIINVYAPAGTPMLYAEPFSAFGEGDGKRWDGISQQYSFGSEAEIIIQQGANLEITKVEKDGNKIYLDVDVVGFQPHQVYTK